MTAGSESARSALIDVSVLVDPATPAWPGDTPWTCRWTWEVARGDSVNVSAMTSSPHVGTHADAPRHIDDAWGGADALPLDAFAGPATVVDVSGHDGALPFAALGIVQPAGGRLLLRTGRTIATGTFPTGWPWLDDDAVHRLLDGGLRLLGVDAPSVDARDSRTLEVHRRLFERGGCILENLDLRGVRPGDWHLSAFPLRLAGLDAAPVRAVLRPLE